MYKSTRSEGGYPAVGVVDMIKNETGLYPLFRLPFAAMEKKAATEEPDEQTAPSASPDQDVKDSDEVWGEWSRGQRPTED